MSNWMLLQGYPVSMQLSNLIFRMNGKTKIMYKSFEIRCISKKKTITVDSFVLSD